MILHATCVAVEGRAALLMGPSGSGKSALGLALMALGAALVADDRTLISARAGQLIAEAPPGLPELIEARGIGLLRARLAGPATVVLAVELGTPATERLPPRCSISLAGCTVDLVRGAMTDHFAPAIRQYLLFGRQD
jgi:HPr kinase/phosphorylase